MASKFVEASPRVIQSERVANGVFWRENFVARCSRCRQEGSDVGISFRRYLKIRLKCLPHIFATSARTMASQLASHTLTSSPVRGASVLVSCATGWDRETTMGELSQQAEKTPQHQLHVLQQQRLEGPRPSQWWQTEQKPLEPHL